MRDAGDGVRVCGGVGAEPYGRRQPLDAIHSTFDARIDFSTRRSVGASKFYHRPFRRSDSATNVGISGPPVESCVELRFGLWNANQLAFFRRMDSDFILIAGTPTEFAL